MQNQTPISPTSYAVHLQQYIKFAPKEVQKKFSNGYHIEDEKWDDEHEECFLFGLKFLEQRVWSVCIQIWQENENWFPIYLEVTEHYNSLLKDYNHYHAAYILRESLKVFKKESNLTENNIILHKIYDRPYLHAKFRHAVTKHHSRERKFCESYQGEHRRLWDKVLHQSILKMGKRFSRLAQQRDERPSSLLFGYTPEPELHIHKDSVQRADEVRSDKPSTRKPRGLSDAFNPKAK